MICEVGVFNLDLPMLNAEKAMIIYVCLDVHTYVNICSNLWLRNANILFLLLFMPGGSEIYFL